MTDRQIQSTREQLPLRTQLWIMAALCLVVLPHIPRLPWWLGLFVIGLAGLQLQRLRRKRRDLPRLLVTALTIMGTLGVLLHHGTLLGRNAGVALVVVMLVLKLLEMRSLRDAMVVIFMCYFVVITNFLFTQTPLIAVYMFVVTIVITTSLSVATHAGTGRSTRSQLRLATTLLLQAIPIMIVLFIFFPRIVGPIWGLPNDAHAGKTGLSNSMSPGAISSLAQSEEEAFRVTFNGPVPEPAQRYWRGPVLWHTDGKTWSQGKVNTNGIPLGKSLRGEPVHYAVTLEPHGKRWLFALDLPVRVSTPAWTTLDYRWTMRQPVNERRHYEATSYLDYNTGKLNPQLKGAALQLPGNITGRMRALANDWRKRSTSNRELVDQSLAYFNTQPFIYTLTPPLLNQNPMDEFLFETRRGFCEHYSAAFVTLIRVAGIPARVVTGYQGGDYNPVGEYWLVRQSDAHAWAEVWLEGDGWVRIDPTAAVAPERIEYGLDPAWLASGEPARFRLSGSGLLANLAYTLDAMSNYWNVWVMSYGTVRQQELLRALGFSNPSWHDMALALLVLVSALLLGIAGWMFLHRPPPPDPVTRAWQTFCKRMARIGLARASSEGPRDYTQRILVSRPDLATPVNRITQLYTLLHYGNPSDVETDRRLLRKLVRKFKRGLL